MPTGFCFSSPQSMDPRRWQRCREAARTQLLAEGFDRLSKKLDDAVRRRALRLWRS